MVHVLVMKMSLKKNNIYINYYEHVLLQVYALSFMQRNMAVIYCL